jgi:putative phage-type endonuclease
LTAFTRKKRAIPSRETWLEWRKSNIGASEVAALFGCHPYITPLQLWGWHRGEIQRPDTDNAAMRRGRIFENAALQAFAEDHHELLVSQGETYHEIVDLRLGATPDGWCGPFRGRHDERLIQVKTVDSSKFESEWRDDGPPVHYLMQCQAEMMVTQATRCVLLVMVLGGFAVETHEYEFAADIGYQTRLVVAIERFWQMVESGEQPNPLDGDQQTLAELHPTLAGDTIALGGIDHIAEAFAEIDDYAREIKRLEREIGARKAEIIKAMGNHPKAVLPGWKASLSDIGPTVIEKHTRKGYRRLTITRERK